MGKVIGIVNRKGGVGKTTTATTLSYLLSKRGYRVALIDFDGQRHTTRLCGVEAPEQLAVTIYDLLKCIVMNEALPPAESYVIQTDTGVDLIPANNRLDNFDKLMCDADFAEYKLKEFVDTIKDSYDYILIDGMPKMGTAMINVMICCDSLIIPVQSETLAVEGMAEFLRAFHRIRNHANANLEIEGILVTMDSERTRVSRHVKAQLHQVLGEKVRIFTNSIPRSVRVPEAVEYGMTICEYEPDNPAAKAYENLVKEMMGHAGTRTEDTATQHIA
jgi:chromosome partitioning protein